MRSGGGGLVRTWQHGGGCLCEAGRRVGLCRERCVGECMCGARRMSVWSVGGRGRGTRCLG